MAKHHGLDLAALDIRVISADSLRLESKADQKRLEMKLILHRPILLLLEPLVRLHSIENAVGEITALLGYLRTLQRRSNVAITLVHLARMSLLPAAPVTEGVNDLEAAPNMTGFANSPPF